MKKTKLLTSIAALALVFSLGACETGDVIINVGDVDIGGGSSSDTEDTETSEPGESSSSSDSDSGNEGGTESRLGLLGEAFILVGQANYTLTCYSTAVNTDNHLSYKGVVTSDGAISTSYTGSTTGMINDPDDGGFVEVTLDGDVLKATAASDTARSVQDYYISSDIDTSLFEEQEDGRFALTDEGFTSDVLQDLFPDRPFTGGLITPTKGTIFIEVEDDLSKVTYYYDSNLNGTFTVTLVVENLGTTVFPYDLSTQYVKYGSESVTSWATFLDSSLKASVDELLGADLDDVLPFFVPDGGYSYTGIWSGKFDLTYSGNADVWVSPLLEFGYTEVTTNSEYVLEGETINYTVTFSSFFGTTDLYLAPTEKPSEPEGPTSWADIVTGSGDYDKVTALLGATLDEILPFYFEEQGYQQYYVTDTRFDLYYGSEPSGLTNTWISILLEDGWTQGETESTGYSTTYPFTKDGYTVELYSAFGSLDIYVYPPVAEPVGPTTWAEFINNAYDLGVLYDTLGANIDDVLPFYYEETGYSAYYAVSGVRFYLSYYYPASTLTDGWLAALTDFGYTLESSASNNYGGTTYTLTYNGYEAEIITSSFGEWTLNLYPPEDTGTGVADQINAVVSKLSEIGSDFDYDEGFYYTNFELRPSDDLSAYYYDELTITATPDNRGYMAQSSMDLFDLEETYYSYEYFSDGTDTYYYDAEDGQSKEEDFYGFETYQAMAEMYFTWMDFDEVLDLIEESASVSDIEVDEDYEISDDTIYIWANNEDWTLYYELEVEYDEDGLVDFSFSYMDGYYAYAVALVSASYVGDPEWYVPDTGAASSPVADILNSINENPNYTIILQITDYQSNETAYDPNGFSPYVQFEPLQDLWCKITYTSEAAVVEYYGSYEELLAGTVMDVEYYLVTDDGLDVFMLFDWYDTDPVYYQWTESGITWAEYLGSLLGLYDYASNFVVGETTTTERGQEIAYTLENLDDEEFLEALISALIDNGNYWAWETNGIDQITDISCSYLVDSEILEFVFATGEYTYYDAEHYCYYLQQTTINVYILGVGSSTTPSYTLEYNW